MVVTETETAFREIRDAFIDQWGAMGGAWGINRTMAQIHALLMVSAEPLCCDAVMEELAISRGNANTNLRELVNWSLVRTVTIRGSRKDFFEAEKDVWKIFCAISRERKRREIDPALAVLESCRDAATGSDHPEATEFARMISALTEFLGLTSQVMDAVSKTDRGVVMPAALKLLGRGFMGQKPETPKLQD